MKKIALIVVALCTLSTLGQSQERPETSVKMESDYDHLDIDHHKNIFFKCWGSPDDHKEYSTSGGAHESTQSSGSLSTKAGAYGQEVVGHRVSWSSPYANQDFDINFSYDISAAQTINQGTDCDDNEHIVRVKSASGSFVSKIELTIPQSVWFVEVKASDIGGTETEANVEITGNEVLKKFTGARRKTDTFVKGETVFFSTRPQDKITLTVKFSKTEVATYHLAAKFHVSFIGQDQCDTLEKNFTNFHADVIQASLGNIAAEPDGLIVPLGCLTRDDFAQKILENNHAKAVTDLIESLQLLGLTSDNPILAKNQYDALRTVSEFAYYHLAYTALRDITPLCQTTMLDDLYTSKNGLKVNAFMANNYFLTRIIHRLRGFQLERFRAFIDGINRVSKNYPTFKAVMADPDRAERIKRAYDVLRVTVNPNPGTLNIDILPYQSSLNSFKKLKLTTTDKVAYGEMLSTLSSMADMQKKFSEELNGLILNLATAADTKISTQAFSATVSELQKRNEDLLEFFSRKAEWYSTSSTTNSFIIDMTNYAIQLARFSGDTLEQTLVEHRSEFLKAYAPERILREERACVSRFN